MHFSSSKSLSKSATFLLAVFSIFTAGIHAQPSFKAPNGLVRQQAAINKLSDRLPAVAEKYGKTPAELRRLLLEDPTLYVDAGDRLLYIDPVIEKPQDAPADESPSESPAGPFPNSQTFSLHSRPGSNRVIYLDFNGHVTSGTVWNTNFTGGQTINSAPFSIDGDPSSFNQQELDAIQYIWQRVAEDYAPFDVDVTTEDPGNDAIIRSSSSDQVYGTRAVISPTDFVGGIGGVAFVGVFNYPGTGYKPAFVMSGNLGNNEKSIAEATSHEVGHNLNLEHDGSPGNGYYLGHGDWAPIMGAGYYRSVSQWSRGEYPGATNSQDDLAIMQSYGISLIADDHANTTAGATILSGGNVNAAGLITTRSDVDVFRFSIGSGNVSININPAPRGANLDIQAQILDAQGNVVATSNPTGLAAGFNQSLSSGVYYLTIDGVGAGNLSTGYSDYASIGQYTITGTLPGGGSSGQPPVAAVSVTTTSGTVPLTVGFSSVNSSDPDGSIVGYSWNFGDGTTSTAPNPVKVYNSAGTFTAVLTVTDNSGMTDTESVTITATQSSSNQPPVAAASANVTSGQAPLNVNFSAQGSYDPDGSIVGYSWNFGDGTASSNQPNPSHTYNNVGNYTATLTVTDNNGATNSRSVGITVQGQPTNNYTLVASPSNVAPGGQLTVSWTAPNGAAAVDWIGLFPVGAPTSQYYWWRYTNGATSGSYGLPAPSQPGQYEFRYMLSDNVTSVRTSNVVTVAESNPTNNVIFVNNISMDIIKSRGEAVVTIYGSDGAPRPNVTVTGNWTGIADDAASGVTDNNGRVTLYSTPTRRIGTIIFTITNLSASGYTYNPSLNNETSDSIVKSLM